MKRRVEVSILNFQCFYRDGKFVETGAHFWFPDDVTLGYIIGNYFFTYYKVNRGRHYDVVCRKYQRLNLVSKF